MASIDFEALSVDALAWYERGDQAAAGRAVRAVEPVVRSLVVRDQGSWGRAQVGDTTQQVLLLLFDRDARRLARVESSLASLFWTIVRNAIASVGRKLGSRKRLEEAVEVTARHERDASVPGSGRDRPLEEDLLAREELGRTERHLLELTPNRAMSVIAYGSSFWGNALFPRARASVGDAQGRGRPEVDAAFAAIEPDSAPTVARAALGPGGSVNAYQQNLSRGRKDLRQMREGGGT